jgi:channel protein (hemolysin III family)
VCVYVFSVVTLLTISGTYHALCDGGARDLWRHFDYSAIWLLIAGTFTAIHGVLHKGRWRTWMLVSVWSLSVAGCLLQSFRFEYFSGPAGPIPYLGVSCVGILSIIKVGRDLGARAVWPIWCAGIIYAVGAVLEATQHPTVIAGWLGPHEIFHLAVIAGISLHWIFIRRLLTVFVPSPALALAVAPTATVAAA